MTARISYPDFTPPEPSPIIAAICDAMGWDTGLGYDKGWIPQGGVIAANLIGDLRERGWQIVPLHNERP